MKVLVSASKAAKLAKSLSRDVRDAVIDSDELSDIFADALDGCISPEDVEKAQDNDLFLDWDDAFEIIVVPKFNKDFYIKAKE